MYRYSDNCASPSFQTKYSSLKSFNKIFELNWIASFLAESPPQRKINLFRQEGISKTFLENEQLNNLIINANSVCRAAPTECHYILYLYLSV